MRGPVAVVLAVAALASHGGPPIRPVGAEWPPVIGAWFWKDDTLAPDGFKPFLDAVASHSPYTLLTTSLRISKGEVVDPAVRDQIGRAVRHANGLGLRIAFDLDVRLARRAFRDRHPEEMQEELVLRIVEVPTNGVEAMFEGRDLSDHMTGGTIPYQCLTTRLVRVYAFERGAGGIRPDTVREIAGDGIRAVADGPCRLKVAIPPGSGPYACVMAAHTYLTPDVFAPHLLEFQRGIVRRFADIPLAGAMKDEWGFPPDHTGNPAHDRFWYSAAMASAYADRAGGSDLVRDALLMHAGEEGRERERLAAINRYGTLCRERNMAIEDDYHRAVKATWGPDAFVCTHATWTPYPGAQEFRKNGLDWWDATRDLGQSDESTPYPCRTSLAKRWGFPFWFNQYYSSRPADYPCELWTGVMGGGRLNVHPVYPRKDMSIGDAHLALLRGRFVTGMSRIRMLDFITRAPIDCPVAVVFGHASAMNWAGPSYNRVGLDVASALGADGWPADLVPSSLAGMALRIDDGGYVCLGSQRYRALVLHQPEFAGDAELAFFARAAAGRTAVFQVGAWTRDAEARPLDAASRLGPSVRVYADGGSCAKAVSGFLATAGVLRVTPWSGGLAGWGQSAGVKHAAPPADGHMVLTDGTFIRAAGVADAAGDPIVETLRWQGHEVAVDAVGLVAIRFAPDETVVAFAAGGLRSVATRGLRLDLPERVDLAFTRAADGRIRGVLQGGAGDPPASLLALTSDWALLAVPPPLPEGRR